MCASFLYLSAFIHIGHSRDLQYKKAFHSISLATTLLWTFLEDGRISSFIFQDNAIFICQDLSQGLLHAKCSLNTSQNKIVNKNISRQASFE